MLANNEAGFVTIWRGVTFSETVVTQYLWFDTDGHRYDVCLERDASACDNDPYSVEFRIDGRISPVLAFFSAPMFRYESEAQYEKFGRTFKEGLYHLDYETVVAMG